MKRKFLRRIAVFTLIFVVLTSFNVLSADVLYQNSFQTQGEQLKRLSGSYQSGHNRITNLGGRGILELRTGVSAKGVPKQYGVIFGDESWNGYTIDVDMKGHQFLTHTMGVVFNYSDAENYYALTWGYGMVGSVWTQMTTPKLRLLKGGIYDTGLLLEETTFPNGVDPLLWHSYRITAKDNTIAVYLDDIKEPIFKYKDSEFIEGGKVGLAVYSNHFASTPGYFDNLTVSK